MSHIPPDTTHDIDIIYQSGVFCFFLTKDEPTLTTSSSPTVQGLP